MVLMFSRKLAGDFIAYKCFIEPSFKLNISALIAGMFGCHTKRWLRQN